MIGPLTRAGRFLRWFLRPFASQEPSFYRAVTACLLAAGLFWQMNALNKTYTTRLELPVAWRFDTARFVPLRALPRRLPVIVTGQGWRLLRANLGVGVRPLELHPVSRGGTRYLPAAAHRDVQNSLEPLKMDEWPGDTLRLTFDRRVTRRFTLALAEPPTTVTPAARQAGRQAQQRYVARWEPATVLLRGPASVVAALPDPWPLVAEELPAPGDSTEQLMPLRGLPPQVVPNVREVRLHLRASVPSSARRSRQQ